mgnify:CR=1 FL=1
MVQQADSILTAETALEAAEQQQVLKQHGSQLTPKQVLAAKECNPCSARFNDTRAH